MTGREQKQSWLDSLQVGDRVFTQTRYSKSITTIENITKTRRIVTKNGHRFNSDGSQYGRGSVWDYAHINPVTDEVLLEFRMKKIISKINKVDWDKVSFDNLEKIAETLDIKT